MKLSILVPLVLSLCLAASSKAHAQLSADIHLTLVKHLDSTSSEATSISAQGKVYCNNSAVCGETIRPVSIALRRVSGSNITSEGFFWHCVETAQRHQLNPTFSTLVTGSGLLTILPDQTLRVRLGVQAARIYLQNNTVFVEPAVPYSCGIIPKLGLN